ncbi:hypothetical protein F4811DRAFT_521617 [Daldinia bambusicola]|nr:hypothetical protein F4811DRAFT_521617 [Daldinia bambusicola]
MFTTLGYILSCGISLHLIAGVANNFCSCYPGMPLASLVHPFFFYLVTYKAEVYKPTLRSSTTRIWRRVGF